MRFNYWWRCNGSSTLETVDHLGLSCTSVSSLLRTVQHKTSFQLQFEVMSNEWHQRRMPRLWRLVTKHECAAINSAGTGWPNRVSMDQSPFVTFPGPCRVCATKNTAYSEDKMGSAIYLLCTLYKVAIQWSVWWYDWLCNPTPLFLPVMLLSRYPGLNVELYQFSLRNLAVSGHSVQGNIFQSVCLTSSRKSEASWTHMTRLPTRSILLA